ncbi:MAG: trimethylamine methyltransferase family protein [Clostridiales bacterium]
MIGNLTFLNKNEIETIHESSLSVLEHTGMIIKSPKACKILAGAGAIVKDSKVTFPKNLMENILKNIEDDVELCARDSRYSLHPYKSKVSINTTNSNSSLVMPWQGGETRKGTLNDLREFIIVCDYFKEIDYFTTIILPSEYPVAYAEIISLYESFLHTNKHIQNICTSPLSAQWQIELGAMVAGGKKNLERNPIFSAQIDPLFSLTMDCNEADTIIALAENGIPILPYSSPLTGITSPNTIAGTLVLGNAELLGILALIKLVNHNGKMIYGADTCAPDLLNGTVNYYAKEYNMFAMANRQMADYYGLPSSVAHDCPEGIAKNQQEWNQHYYQVLLNFYVHSDICAWVGCEETGFTASLPEVVLAAKFIDQCKLFDTQQSCFSPGEGSEFIRNYLENNRIETPQWIPPRQYVHTGTEVVKKIDQKIERILNTHKTEPLEKKLRTEMGFLLEKAAQKLIK